MGEKTVQSAWTVFFLLLGGLSLTLLLTRPPPVTEDASLLDAVTQRGVLRVVTLNSPVTYYWVHDEEAGIEFELARGFARHLGVDLQMVVASTFGELFRMLARGDADLAAANITATEARRAQVRFGPPYMEAVQHVVYKAGSRRPRKPADLVGRSLAVIAESSYVESLRALARSTPELKWVERRDADIEALFEAITEERLELTVADSTVLDVHQRFYPELKRAFALTEGQPIAWAFSAARDESLLQEAGSYFRRLEQDGRLNSIKQRYHAYLPRYDRVNTLYFLRHINSRLKPLIPYFQRAAEETGFDWILLAAIAYQESLWDHEAVSPTGVRGIMMLTNSTARMMGVDDRADPLESILGGARYLARVERKIPDRIPRPDRLWMALAAYNIGYGHLEDARILAQRGGGDPDRWADVRAALPLLNQKAWHSQTRNGYARGTEAVRYVQNIRSFYDILNWRLARRDLAFVDHPTQPHPAPACCGPERERAAAQ